MPQGYFTVQHNRPKSCKILFLIHNSMAQTNIGTGMMPPQQYEPFLSFLQQLVLPGSGWTTVHAADQFSCYITPPGLLDPGTPRG